MKFNKFYAAAALALASMLSTSAMANLVLNGSFEDGFDEWGKASTMFVSVGSPYAHTGNQSAKTTCNPALCLGEGATGSFFSQNLNTTAGSNYTLSFWIGEVGNSESGFSVFWDGLQVANESNYAIGTLGTPNSAGMKLYSMDLTATSASTAFRIQGRKAGADFIYFDDVSVEAITLDTSNVPEPSSLALIGLGLAGLAFAKRKKA